MRVCARVGTCVGACMGVGACVGGYVGVGVGVCAGACVASVLSCYTVSAFRLDQCVLPNLIILHPFLNILYICFK